MCGSVRAEYIAEEEREYSEQCKTKEHTNDWIFGLKLLFGTLDI